MSKNGGVLNPLLTCEKTNDIMPLTREETI